VAIGFSAEEIFEIYGDYLWAAADNPVFLKTTDVSRLFAPCTASAALERIP